MLNFKFKKEFKQIISLARKLELDIRKGKSFEEKEKDALKINDLMESIYYKLNLKQRRKFKNVYVILNQCAFGFNCFKDNFLQRMMIHNLEAKNIWTPYIKNMLIFYSYRVFNIDFLKPIADIYLNSVKYDPNDSFFRLLLSDIIDAHNGEEFYNQFIDNNYDSIKSKALIDLLYEPLKEYLNGEPLLISNEDKQTYKEKKLNLEYQNYIDSVGFNYSINIDSKTKFKLPKTSTKNYTFYGSDINYKMDEYNKRTHDQLVRYVIEYPNSFNVLNYIVSVICGQPHYTKLDEHINKTLNESNVLINNYPDYENDEFVKVLVRYFMLYVGISSPSSKLKAYEYLQMNMKVLVKNTKLLKIVLSSLPKKVSSLLSLYFNEVNLDEDYKKLYLTLNPLNLNVKELKVYLENSTSLNIYNSLKFIKDNNELIFNHVYSKYKDIYNEEHEKYLKALEEQKIKDMEALKQKAIEDEKKRKLEEENKRILEMREQIKESNVGKTSKILSNEELEELSLKTSDLDSVLKLAEHYFELGNTEAECFKLASKYYVLSSKLGSKYGNANAAVSLYNLSLRHVKLSDEWKDIYNQIFKILEEGTVTVNTFFSYALYSTIYEGPNNSKYIEETYNELKETLNEVSLKYINSAYYFYKKDYYSSIVNFNEIKDYTERSAISQYISPFMAAFIEENGNIINPYTNNFDTVTYLNPYAKGHHELQMKVAKYNTYLQIAAKAREVLDWGCSIHDIGSMRNKGLFVYYGTIGYKVDKKEALILLDQVKHTFKPNDTDLIETYNKLLKEFGRNAKKIIG